MGDVAIIIPALNERAHIGPLVADMLRQAPDRVAEVIVVDGGSDDGTRQIVARFGDHRLRLLDNPRRVQSAGVNLAARAAGDAIRFIVRVDAHARYPTDFIEALLDAQARSGAESVVNRLRSVGETCFQLAVAAASNSPFGTGGAAHRSGGTSRFIDHGHHALFDRRVFLRVGGYDERFATNEDAEFDVRLRAAGGRIWFTDTATVDYFPRRTPAALARQYRRYGQGRAMTRTKHRERLRARQLIPPILLAVVSASLLGMVLAPGTGLIAIGYLLACAAAAAFLAAKARDRCVLGAAVALPIMHLSWGLGFLEGWIGARWSA